VFDVLATGDLDMAVVGAYYKLAGQTEGGIRVELLLHFIPVDLVDR
jgi:hypothetical protein